MKTKPPFDMQAILIGGFALMLISAAVLSFVLIGVGEAVEHFTP